MCLKEQKKPKLEKDFRKLQKMTNLTRILMIFVMPACCDIWVGDGLRSYFNNYYDEMATSSCTALSASYNIRGHIAAIRRTCGSGPSCIGVCKNAKKLRGNDLIHMFKNILEAGFDSFNCSSYISWQTQSKFLLKLNLIRATPLLTVYCF